MMGWRDFISLLGSAVAWPFAARAQQPEQMRRIGVLMNMAADDPQGQASIAAFHQGLQEWGWMLGRNARIDDTVTASAPRPRLRSSANSAHC
jgi:putative ABC transport system substrate-binding protein